MSRAVIVILLLLAFASGLGSGLVLGRSRVVHGVDIPTSAEVLDAMAEEVGLSTEQKAQCAAIRDKHHPRAVKIKQSEAQLRLNAELAAIRSDMRADMSAVMNETQREAFRRFYTRRDAQREAKDR